MSLWTGEISTSEISIISSGDGPKNEILNFDGRLKSNFSTSEYIDSLSLSPI